MSRPLVSLCMIVKNEEKKLPICLESVKGLFDEIIVVDTGSTDNTKKIAEGYEARVVDFPWTDDFSAARNRCLEEATGKWIFCLDADHFVDQENYRKIKKLIEELGDEEAAYTFYEISQTPLLFPYSVHQIHLFRNNPRIRWVYRIHEQIQYSLNALGHQIRKSDILIHHTGYNLEEGPAKAERNAAILEKERQEYAQDTGHLIHVLYDLARSYRGAGNPQEALTTILEAQKITPECSDYYSSIYSMLTLIYQDLKQWDKALESCQKVKSINSQIADPYFIESLIHEKRGDLTKAHASLLQVLQSPIPLRSDDLSMENKIRYRLGMLSYKQGNTAEAEKRWLQTTRLYPNDHFSWLGLAELFTTQRRSVEALAASQRAKYLIPQLVDPAYWESIAWDQLGYPINALDCLTNYLLHHANSCRILNSALITPVKIEHALGVYCLNAGQPEKAKNYWNAALQIDPFFQPSQEALKLLG